MMGHPSLDFYRLHTALVREFEELKVPCFFLPAYKEILEKKLIIYVYEGIGRADLFKASFDMWCPGAGVSYTLALLSFIPMAKRDFWADYIS
jgi:hypothetical protein